MNKKKPEPPYIITKKRVVIVEVRKYNPNYGDRRICRCGHEYERHFDSYPSVVTGEINEAVGCKYCGCGRGYDPTDKGFVELKPGEEPCEIDW